MAQQKNRAQGSSNSDALQKEVEELRKIIAANNLQASQSASPPLSYQPTPAADNNNIEANKEMYKNRFDLPEALKMEIRSKGYNFKFINFTTYKKDTVHRSQWVPYKPEARTTMDMVFGKSPEGYIVRGDCVLAVRPLVIDKAFKDRIKANTNRLLGHNDRSKQELRELAKQHGIKKSHIVGDDDDE